MAINTTLIDDQVRIQLSGALTITDALETRDQLALALSTSERAEVDMSDVIEIDTAGLQLLMTLRRESIPVAINYISDPLREMLASLNLLTTLGLEEEQHGS